MIGQPCDFLWYLATDEISVFPLFHLRGKRADYRKGLPIYNEISNGFPCDSTHRDTEPAMPTGERNILPGRSPTQKRARVRRFRTQTSPDALDSAVCQIRENARGNIEQVQHSPRRHRRIEADLGFGGSNEQRTVRLWRDVDIDIVDPLIEYHALEKRGRGLAQGDQFSANGWMDTFNGNYGLNRGIASALLIGLVLLLFVHGLVYWQFALLLLFSAGIALYRTYRFGVRYARELFVQFLQIHGGGDGTSPSTDATRQTSQQQGVQSEK